MEVRIIDNIKDFPQFETQNVFQTREWMRVFQAESDSKVVVFAVYDGLEFVMMQSVLIQRFIKWLSCGFGSYAVVLREPWCAKFLIDSKAVEAFEILSKGIEKYCRNRVLYIEYRHFSVDNIYSSVFESYKKLPWYNVYQRFSGDDSVEMGMNKSKRRQLKLSFEAGVEVELNPTNDEVKEWYLLLQKLYKRIHRPLPSLQVFLNLKDSGIGKVFVVKYQDRVVSGVAMLHNIDCQCFYEWYIASESRRIKDVYPSVVATWKALCLALESGGRFDFMGAGPRDKTYGVRDFKLSFGGELTPEYRYRKLMLF